jgi:hypothetical protein
MCLNNGGGGGTNTAAIDYQRQQDAQARIDEAARTARIALGREQIDRLFDKGETLVPGSGAITPSTQATSPTVAQAQAALPNGIGEWLTLTGIGPSPSMGTAPLVTTTPAEWQGGKPAFDQAFYDRRRQAYVDQAMPALTDQFTKARENMAFALARAGLTRSSVSADKQSELAGKNTQAAGEIGIRAAGDVSNLRSQVEDARANLITGLQASADPAGAANLALARTQQLAGQPIGVDTLGDVFGGIGQGIGSFVSGVRQKQLYDRFAPQTLTPKSGTTTSKLPVVGN